LEFGYCLVIGAWDLVIVPSSDGTFGEPYGEGGSFAQLTFDLNVSPMEFDNFLNEGKTNS
jgi:hypothetical protein